jgi:tetratricopeptide (TPR) repeat protein
VTDQTPFSLADSSVQLQAIEAAIEATLWNDALDEVEALHRFHQASEAIERVMLHCDPAALSACQALLAYALLREDDLLFELDGDVSASLSRMEHAVSLAETSGNEVQLGRCLMVQGERLALAERPDETRRAWERCEALSRANDDRDHRQLLGWLLIMRARQAMREEALNQADILAQEAKRVLEAIEDEAGMGALYGVLALLYEGLGRPAADVAIVQAEAGRWTARARRRHAAPAQNS